MEAVMSIFTLVFYGAAAAFLAAMLIGPIQRMARAARRREVECPRDTAPATVWATPLEGGGQHLESCSRLPPGHTCGEECLREAR
jgi:hypothetical protein